MQSRRHTDNRHAEIVVLAAGVTVAGKISGHCDIVLSGTVVGDADIQGLITVSENGHWQGDIRCHRIAIAGQVTGAIIASGQVEIGPTAKISGTVTGAAIAVGEGAVIDGTLHTVAADNHTEFTEKRDELV